MRIALLILSNIAYASFASDDHQKNLEERLKEAKLNLWSRGEYNYDSYYSDGTCTLEEKVDLIETVSKWPPVRLGPIRKIRQRYLNEDCIELDCPTTLLDKGEFWTQLRGGGTNQDPKTSHDVKLRDKIDELGRKFGPEFLEAIKKNEQEHARDCSMSCESFYCAPETSNEILEDSTNQFVLNGTSFISYSFGATPPEDFAEHFGFPLDLIKVTKGNPLFSHEEAASVIRVAKAEGVDDNEFKSGKYRLGGDWLTNLPMTRKWFNDLLESKLFPLLPKLFPQIVSSPSVLRAHSVSLLKYNVTHPRTDVHIDNGILAMTLAMTPISEYEGGGTFFEHMDTIIPMDVGHGTFRPGSVRHGGHKVVKGTRYILGAFLLIKDRVEHVRRLKNRGSELRRIPDLEGAARHFEWALAINPKCTTCLKDWAEILLTQKNYNDAEEKMRQVLELLEDKDSDALFSLGVILSEAGRDDESIDAYIKSVKLNAEDAELCYNLGIKLGAKGDKKAEMAMYARATNVNPKFGGAWLNWGTVLAEDGNFEDAEVMFLKGMECEEVKTKAIMNLALVYQKQAERNAAEGSFDTAKDLVVKAGDLLDSNKGFLENVTNDDDRKYAEQFTPLRLQAHRILGSIYAGMKDFLSCEAEFRKATENFPQIRGSWEMLARILEVQGKTKEVSEVRAVIHNMQ